MSTRFISGMLQASIVFGYMVYQSNVWSGWLSSEVAIAACSLPAAVCLLSFINRLRRFSRWTCSASFLALAIGSSIAGTVFHNRLAIVSGVFCGFVGVYIMVTGGRHKEWRGVPYGNFFLAAVALAGGVVAATISWEHWTTSLACVIIPIPFAIGCVLNRRWASHYGVAILLLCALLAGIESMEESAWLTLCVSFVVFAIACPFVFRVMGSFK